MAGATGLVGSACVRHHADRGDSAVVALSRSEPVQRHGVQSHRLDLLDRDACRRFAQAEADATHLVYAAVQEEDTLVDGWRSEAQIDRNDHMFRNLLDSITEHAPGLRHVTLLQGTKAYGVHVREIRSPAREGRSEMREQPNFYWRQEDHLKASGDGSGWGWTIFRPVHIFGDAIGSSLNPIAAIGVYGAILAAEGEPLHYPGGAPRITQAIDVDILAEAIAWAGKAPSARNQVFNIANGDVFSWENVWPAIASALGMPHGEARPMSVAAFMQDKHAAWNRIRARHGLLSPELDVFVGRSFQFLDYTFRHGITQPQTSLVSTVKLHTAGFTTEMDTEDMFAKWFRRLQERRLLPMPDAACGGATGRDHALPGG